jgi:hypothetical protein
MALTMNPTTYAGGKTVEVIGDGSTALNLLTYLVSSIPILLQGISFYPNAGGDVVTIREGSATGPRIWKKKASAISNDALGDDLIFSGRKRCSPYIKGDELPSGAMVVFHLI